MFSIFEWSNALHRIFSDHADAPQIVLARARNNTRNQSRVVERSHCSVESRFLLSHPARLYETV